ncbi:hypothetical protein DM807_01620 [Pseudomonas hunanensis]|nr:hypothetical protein [Pseudomonas hunanensis]
MVSSIGSLLITTMSVAVHRSIPDKTARFSSTVHEGSVQGFSVMAIGSDSTVFRMVQKKMRCERIFF